MYLKKPAGFIKGVMHVKQDIGIYLNMSFGDVFYYIYKYHGVTIECVIWFTTLYTCNYILSL